MSNTIGEVIPTLKDAILELRDTVGNDEVEEWLNSISQYNTEDQRKWLLRIEQTPGDHGYHKSLFQQLLMQPSSEHIDYMRNAVKHMKDAWKKELQKQVAIFLIDCPKPVEDALELRGMDYLCIHGLNEPDKISNYLKGADSLIICDMSSGVLQMSSSLIAVGTAKDMGVKCVCIVPQEEFTKSLPYKDYGTTFGNSIDALRMNCAVLAVDMIDETSPESIIGITIQLYEMLSRKDVVKNYSDDIDAEWLKNILQVQNEMEGNLLVTTVSGSSFGANCGEKAAQKAVENLHEAIIDKGYQLPDWAIVQVVHHLSKKNSIGKDAITEFDGDWVRASERIRKYLKPTATLTTQIHVINSNQDEQSITVRILAPSRSQGVAQWRTPIYKTLIDLKKSNDFLKVSNKLVVAEKRQTEELMAFISHSTRGDLVALESSLKQNDDTHASQSIVETLKKEMELFSFLSSDPKKIIEQMRDDTVGKVSLRMLIDHAVFSSMLLVLSPESRDKGLINHRYLKYAKHIGVVNTEVKQKDWVETSSFNDFQEKLFMDFLQVKKDAVSAHAWILSSFGEIKVNIGKNIHIDMTKHGMRATVLSAILSELVINAFKFGVADETKPIMEISCTTDSEQYQFSCCNVPSKMEQKRSQKGSRKGQEAMSLLLAKLHLSPLDIALKNGTYGASFCMNKYLMGG